MNFNQCVGGALHRPRLASRAQQAAHQRRLAGTEVALEPDHHAPPEMACKRSPQAERGGFVGQR